MYLDFYKLSEKPFELTPSPQFLYLGESHKEALALLTYGVVERKGFVLLTGEVGTGKTTTIQAFLADLDKSHEYVHISNPLLSPKEFMDYLSMLALKKTVRLESKADFLMEFEAFLKACLQHKKTFTLIIDEAQTLSFKLLEEVRLLSNMESASEKLINIFLVGQPELNEKLSDPRSRALLQRISIRYQIRPLSLEDTGRYMATRLSVAGVEDVNEIFTKGAVEAINTCSGGYPRVINVLADNCLLLGYSKGKRKISSSIVQKSYEDMGLDLSIPNVTQAPPGPPENGKKRGRYWKWFIALFLIVIGVILGMGVRIQDFFGKQSDLRPAVQDNPVDGTTHGKALKKASKPLENQGIKDALEHGESKKEEGVEPKPRGQLEGPTETPVKDDPQIRPEEAKKPEETKRPEEAKKGESHTPFQSLIIREGDTLSKLAIRVYGKFDDHIINLIHKYNPEIGDLNLIRPGKGFILPVNSLPNQGPVYTIHIASFRPFQHAKNLLLAMTKKGYEGYIIPIDVALEGKAFRVTLGTFGSHSEAKDSAARIMQDNISDYAEAIKLDIN